jgi:flagellar biosynthesis/type III secretory pathway M-ring protein FliF/YscJ
MEGDPMDFLRSQLAIVQDRLAGLTASQRMLAGALVVILVMTMLYWGKIAGSTERVALPASPTQPEELAQLTATLKAKGIDVTVENGKVMVPAGREIDAMGEASFNGLVPASTGNALDAMLDKITPWNTSGQFTARMNSAKQQYLAAILKKWPGVQGVDVVIADTPQAAITRRDPNMAVYIQTKAGASINRRQMAQSARQFVSRSMTGLRAENISIAIDGASISAGGDADVGLMSNDLLDTQRAAESDLISKLRNQLSYIPEIRISVAVDVDNASSTEKQHTVDPKNKLSEAEEIETKTQKPVGPATPQQEPGVIANVAIDANGGAAATAGPSGIEIEDTKTKNRVDYGIKDTTTTRGPGKYTIAGATVGVPRSNLIAIWRQRRAGDAQKDPTDAEIQPIADAITKNVRQQIVAVTGIKEESRITVTDIWDLEPIVGGPVLAAASAGVGGELQSLATSHAKEVVLGILAVASLFMVSRMVKKAEPIALNVPALAGAGGLALAGFGGGGDGIATVGGGDGATRRKSGSVGGEDIAGEVGGDGNNAVMMGQELDPEVLETSQIIEQVSNFVKTNPDQAAQMVSRWMSRD